MVTTFFLSLSHLGIENRLVWLRGTKESMRGTANLVNLRRKLGDSLVGWVRVASFPFLFCTEFSWPRPWFTLPASLLPELRVLALSIFFS